MRILTFIFVCLSFIGFAHGQVIHSFTCCQKAAIPDDIKLVAESTELVVTPAQGISFPSITDQTQKLTIFGRWGNKLFESKNPGVDFKWTGRKDDGTMLPEGTYYYIITQFENRGSSGEGETKGFITLLN